MEEHWKPPPPVQGSLKEIFTDTSRAFVKDVEAVTYAVGRIVSAKLTKLKSAHHLSNIKVI